MHRKAGRKAVKDKKQECCRNSIARKKSLPLSPRITILGRNFGLRERKFYRLALRLYNSPYLSMGGLFMILRSLFAGFTLLSCVGMAAFPSSARSEATNLLSLLEGCLPVTIPVTCRWRTSWAQRYVP